MAERLLDNLGVDYEEIDVTNAPEVREQLVEETGQKTVPQIFIDGESIGGYDELNELHQNGQLEEMIES
jgi:glutaredoxin